MSSTKKAKESTNGDISPITEASPTEDTTQEQIAHARRMLVDCPFTGEKRHCWHCSRCDEARSCLAWRTRRTDVEFFRKSEKPYSLYLVEEMEAVEVMQ